VLVAGVSGSGKTTLAARIARMTGGPHTEIDGLFHGPGWEPRPEFSDEVRAFTAADTWTTEWQYSSVRELLAERADLLVWLDLAFVRVTLPRVVRRTLRRRIHRTELWNGNREPRLRTIFRDPEHIIRWSISSRNAYADRVPAAERAHPQPPAPEFFARHAAVRAKNSGADGVGGSEEAAGGVEVDGAVVRE